MTKNFWIIGCGDIGLRLARLHISSGENITGVVRTKKSLQKCKQAGIDAIAADLDTDDFRIDGNLNDALVYYFAPPPTQGTDDPRIERFLAATGNAIKRIVLISTTGVYGNQHGAWVDETTPPEPVTDRARRRLHAELAVKKWAEKHRREYIVLRVPGIYAQDRLPLQRLKKGLPIIRESEAPWTNRIHAEDLVHICKTAMVSERKNTIYNVSDGTPGTMTDYFNQVADFAGLPRPPQITLERARRELSQGMLSYLSESRRISNRKMRDELGIVLQYPNLSAGLAE